MVKKTFLRGGVHPANDGKGATANRAIERFIPSEVTIPLSQHLGPTAEAVVQRKSRVTRGDCIAKSDTNGAPIHASVSGMVKRVALSPHPTLVEAMAIVIETDSQAAETSLTFAFTPGC